MGMLSEPSGMPNIPFYTQVTAQEEVVLFKERKNKEPKIVLQCAVFRFYFQGHDLSWLKDQRLKQSMQQICQT